MGMAIAVEVLVGVAFAATVSTLVKTAQSRKMLIPRQPLLFAVASEVLPRKHRLAGQAAINAVSN
jgi:hypothetical protein